MHDESADPAPTIDVAELMGRPGAAGPDASIIDRQLTLRVIARAHRQGVPIPVAHFVMKQIELVCKAMGEEVDEILAEHERLYHGGRHGA